VAVLNDAKLLTEAAESLIAAIRTGAAAAAK
jgi:hypothetical protein